MLLIYCKARPLHVAPLLYVSEERRIFVFMEVRTAERYQFLEIWGFESLLKFTGFVFAAYPSSNLDRN